MGQTEATAVSANSYVDIPVTFQREFSSSPRVVCSLGTNSTSADMGSFAIAPMAPTKTGVTIRVYNNSSSSRVPAINWIAIRP